MKNLGRKIFKVANVLVVIALLLCYASGYMHPKLFWMVNGLALIFPLVYIANLLFILLWLWRKSSWLLLSLVIAIIGWGNVSNHFQWSGCETEEDGINVLSYNVRYFRDDENKAHHLDTIINFLNGQKSDIICLQEASMHKWGKYNPASLKLKLKGIKHYQLAHTSDKTGPLTYTRFPILDMGEIRFDRSGNIVIYTDILVNDDTLRIYNCHLQSYKIKPKDYKFIDSLSVKPNDKQIEEIKQFSWKMKKAMKMRADQANEVKQHIEASPYPVIVCGDFNAPPMSYAYRKMRSNLKDAFVKSGKGWGNTLRGKFMNFRIDYILTNENISPMNYKAHKVSYSDHFPITSTLIYKN
ncbi:hypothetical protein EMN47_05485 [Prolixibacteraceae bacterium JC049]|nr:hypothetical protein [Prolixibacteraceae bacterium JC049]